MKQRIAIRVRERENAPQAHSRSTSALRCSSTPAKPNVNLQLAIGAVLGLVSSAVGLGLLPRVPRHQREDAGRR